jgi:iron complex outermembrane recepter protein
MSRSESLRSACCCILAAAASTCSALAIAQTVASEDEPQEVVVTGTRIRGIEPVGSPVIAVGQEEIARASVTSTTDLLRQIPQINSYGADESTVSGGSAVQGSILNNTFARAANLRGLGTTATLVLINGHRVAPGGHSGQLVDMDSIPQAAIANVEVVADGASALYGSDAVAGVINLVLRRDFEGAETTVRYGSADGSDQYQLGQTFGTRWDGGSVFMAFEHQRRNALAASDRRKQYNDDLRPYGGSAPPALSSPGNVLIGGVAYPLPGSQNGSDITLASLGVRGQPNLQSVWTGQDILPDQERNSFTATLNHDLTDRIELFADAQFTRREFEIDIGASNSGAAGFAVPSSNPFSPCAPGKPTANAQGIACPPSGTVNVQYSFIDDLGPTHRTGTSEMWSARSGLEFDLGEWNASIAASHSRNSELVRTPNINATAANAAISGQAPWALAGASGVLVRPTGLTPLNVFCGDTACNDPATLAFISSLTEQTADFEYTNVALNADGSLFDLPGGAVRLAAGGEYRRDSLDNVSGTRAFADPALSTKNVTGASRDVLAAYGELYIPIVGSPNAMAGIERLELSLAARFEDYSDFGTTTNPKVGLTWSPIEQVRVRASYGRSFRAPTLSDIDPTSTGVRRAVALTPTQAVAAGLAAAPNLSALLTQGGTEGIEPERAKTWSFGVDYSPLDDLTLSAGYYRIEYDNRIDSPALNAGVPASLSQRSLYASRILLNPTYYASSTISQAEFNERAAAITGSTRPAFSGVPPALANVVAIVNGSRDNTGSLETSGIDFAARYAGQAGFGGLRAGLSGTYVFNYDYSILPGAPTVDYVNEFNSIGSPLRFRARGEIGADIGEFSATAFVNYSNGYDFPRNLLPAAAPARYERVDSYLTVDTTFSYDFAGGAFTDGLRAALSIQNVFDEEPPLVLNGGSSSIQFDPTNASALGRLISLQMTNRW